MKSLLLLLQATSNNDTMNAFRESGKYPVVLGVLAIILVGVITYLIRIDRRITRMEKNQQGK